MQTQRRWHAIFPRSGIHFRLFIPLLGAIALFDIVILNLVLWVLREVSALPDLTSNQILIVEGLRRRMLFYASVAIMGPAVLSVFMMAFQTHRTIGPLVNIRRHVRKLIDGNYGDELRLRSDDELGEVANDLNELTLKLRAK